MSNKNKKNRNVEMERDFSFALMYFMKKNNLNSAEMAQKVKCSGSYISNWKNGKDFPSDFSLSKLKSIGLNYDKKGFLKDQAKRYSKDISDIVEMEKLVVDDVAVTIDVSPEALRTFIASGGSTMRFLVDNVANLKSFIEAYRENLNEYRKKKAIEDEYEKSVEELKVKIAGNDITVVHEDEIVVENKDGIIELENEQELLEENKHTIEEIAEAVIEDVQDKVIEPTVEEPVYIEADVETSVVINEQCAKPSNVLTLRDLLGFAEKFNCLDAEVKFSDMYITGKQLVADDDEVVIYLKAV